MIREVAPQQLIELGMAEPEAAELARRVNACPASLPAEECWREVSRGILTPAHPFGVHKLLYELAYADRDPAAGPAPAWTPPEDFLPTTNIARLMEELGLASYPELHAWSVQKRPDYWETMARKLGIRFKQPYSEVMDASRSAVSPEWFKGARLNIADSCFQAPGDAPAIVYRRAGNPLSTVTYQDLEALVNRVANSLGESGLEPGDAVAIDMPMTPEAVAAYLGIVKAGCAVVSIADSFAPEEIAKRLRLADTEAVFTQDFIRYGDKQLPLFDKVAAAEAPRAIVLPCGEAPAVRLRDGDLSWDAFLSANDRFESVSCRPGDVTNILFSSGTTGDPKVIPWTQTAPIKCAADAHLHQNVQPGDVVAWPTSLGWMMGPWLIYAALVNRASIALYCGAPTGRGFGEFVQDAGVTMLGVVPSLVKAWRNSGCLEGLDWSGIKAFSSTGECSNAEDMLFLMSRAGYRPVIEYCGGTELAGGYITDTVVQPSCPATFSTPVLGLDLVILDEEERPAEDGEVFLVPPSVGLSARLLHGDHQAVYFAGTPLAPNGVPLRRHGDQIERLAGGRFRAHGRVDDTMNLGGIKVSSAEIERAVNRVEGVRETAAVAVPAPGGGASRLIIFVVPEGGGEIEKGALKAAMQGEIRLRINPLFKIHDVVPVEGLPRTASNKVMRRMLRARQGESAQARARHEGE